VFSVHADPLGYATEFDRLYRVDFGTGSSTRIGTSIEFADVEGLALANDGTLFGVSDATKQLIRINTSTGKGTLVGSLGLTGQGAGTLDSLDFGLAFTCDGKLWLSSDTTDRLWQVDPASGAATLVGNTGAHISGLAGSGYKLYGIGSSGDERLYQVNTATGAATAIGALFANTGKRQDDAGLDFDAAGQLWAVFDYSPSQNIPSDLAGVALATGASTVVGHAPAGMEGLAISGPGTCPPPGGGSNGEVPAIPTLSSFALALLAALTLLAGWAGLGRRRDTR